MNRQEAQAFVARKRDKLTKHQKQIQKDLTSYLSQGYVLNTEKPAWQFGKTLRAGLDTVFNPTHEGYWIKVFVVWCLLALVVSGLRA